VVLFYQLRSSLGPQRREMAHLVSQIDGIGRELLLKINRMEF
jgi:hypothetical protein